MRAFAATAGCRENIHDHDTQSLVIWAVIGIVAAFFEVL